MEKTGANSKGVSFSSAISLNAMAVQSCVEKDSELCPGPLGKKGLDLITTVYPVLTSFTPTSNMSQSRCGLGWGGGPQRTRDAAFRESLGLITEHTEVP